jgi:lipoprotein-releasing system permease protein
LTDAISDAGAIADVSAADAAARPTVPFAPFEWMIAFRYLRARRARGSISVIAGLSITGIALGVAALIVVMSVMNGFRHELLDKIVGINGHMFLQSTDAPLTDYDAITKRITALEGVTLALPMIEAPAAVATQYAQSGALVRGVREADLGRLPGIAGHIRQGTLDGFDGAEGIAVGQRLAETLGVSLGDTVSILTANGAQTPFGVAPRRKAYPVVAIFEIGMSEFDSTFVYLPLAEAQAFFNKPDTVSVIEAFVADPDDMDTMRARFDAALPRPMVLTDWRQRNKTFFDALDVERNVMFIVVALVVLVAALNIIAGLIMLVKDKGRDIAILRTMGATSGAIMRIFLINGATIGVLGTFVGLALGLVTAWNLETVRGFLNRTFNWDLFPRGLYFLSHLPSVVESRSVTAVVVMALTLSILATLYPSWRAARLDPVEALRYE